MSQVFLELKIISLFQCVRFLRMKFRVEYCLGSMPRREERKMNFWIVSTPIVDRSLEDGEKCLSA